MSFAPHHALGSNVRKDSRFGGANPRPPTNPDAAQQAAKLLAAKISQDIVGKTAMPPPQAMQPEISRPGRGKSRSGFPVFVGDLKPGITEDQICESLKECGRIISCRVIREHTTQASKGFGFVNFEQEEDRQRAIQLDKKVCIGDCPLTLRIANSTGGKNGTSVQDMGRGTNVWIGSLPTGPEGRDVEGLKLCFEKITGFPCVFFNLKDAGYGFLNYATAEQAQTAAYRLNNADCKGQILRASIAYANSEARQSLTKRIVALNNSIEAGQVFNVTDLTLLEKSIRTLWLGRLPFGTTARDIKEAFMKFGEVHSTTIMRDKMTGVEKNCGFVCFDNWRSTHSCLEEHNKQKRFVKIQHVPLAICRANPHKRIQLSAFQHGLIDMDGNPTMLFTNAVYGETLPDGQEAGAQPQAQYYQDPATGQIYAASQLAQAYGYQQPINVVFPDSKPYTSPVTHHTQLAEHAAHVMMAQQTMMQQAPMQAPMFQPPPNFPPPQQFHAPPPHPGFPPQAFPPGFQPAIGPPQAPTFRGPPLVAAPPQPGQPVQLIGPPPQLSPPNQQQNSLPERPRLPPMPHAAQPEAGQRQGEQLRRPNNMIPPQRGRNRFAPYGQDKNRR